jgi:hypothetical protein
MIKFLKEFFGIGLIQPKKVEPTVTKVEETLSVVPKQYKAADPKTKAKPKVQLTSKKPKAKIQKKRTNGTRT